MSIVPLNEAVVIVNVPSGRLLDADTDTINADGTRVQLYGRDAAGQSQRQWRLASAGGNKYHIICAASGRFLDADTQTIQNDGTKVQLYGTEIPAPLNRQWQFLDARGSLVDDKTGWLSIGSFQRQSHVYIRNAQSGRLLDAEMETIQNDGTKVQLYGTDGSTMPNRQWRVIRLSDYGASKPAADPNEAVVIVNVVSGRLLDADTGTINTDGTRVQLFERDAAGQSQRQWRIASAGGNNYHIICAASGRFLDANTQTIQNDGTKVQLYGTEIPAPLNRQWRFDDAGDGRYYIRNAASGRLLDADIRTLAQDATNVQLYGTDGSNMPNRQWRVIRLSDYEASKPATHSFQDAPPHFDLFILAPLDFGAQFDAFRTAKRNYGVESHLALLTGTPQAAPGLGRVKVLTGPASVHGGVVNDFPGADDAERVKRAIEYAHRVHGAKYVMLAGDASLFPCRWRFIREADDPKVGKWAGWHDGTYHPSDLYYASLYRHPSSQLDSWDANADNKYNEQQWGVNVAVSYNPDNVDGYPDVAVGRIPAHTADDLQTYLQKVVAYETQIIESFGPKPFCFIADWNWSGADQLCNGIRDAVPEGYASFYSNHLFNSSSSDPLLTGWVRGVDGTLLEMAKACWWIVYIGHGYSGGWSVSGSDSGSVKNLNNAPNFPVVFAAACDTGEFLGNPPLEGSYRDNLGRFRCFSYHEDAPTAQQIEERDANGNLLRYVQKPLTVPTPSPYDLPTSSNRTVASAWLFNSSGGAIAYFGEVLVCPDNPGSDLGKDFVAALGNSSLLPLHSLGDIWLLAQQQYWNDNKYDLDVFGAPRLYLGIMTFFGDPSVRMPPWI